MNKIKLDNDPGITPVNISILLVDDNKVNQFLGKQILRNIGFTSVQVASDGFAALKMIHENDFDILLTDVEMPGMSGYELTTSIRQLNEAKKNITIIALTANSSEDEHQRALQLGMNDYLSKPYAPEELQAVLQRHIKAKGHFFIAETGSFNLSIHPPMDAIYALFNGNKQDVKVLLGMLKEQIPTCMDQLKEAIIENNWIAAFNASHKLKSTVKLFNIDSLFNKASLIAESSKNLTEIHLVPSMYDELHAELQGIQALINKELEEI